MKPFELFKAGRHTSAAGATLDFTEDHLRAAVQAYDPALHEAPIVVGHPRDNAPAYGWVKSLAFAEGTIVAEPIQVDAAFAEMVAAGRFKKRSASFYTPDAPNNPKPGTYYLRHVGFLGAQPPAVKGLKDVSFSDAEEGVVEFADSQFVASLVARMMRNLREWIIADKGVEAADKVAPDYLISDLEAQAREPVQPAGTMPAFSEEDDMPTVQELQAQLAARDAEIARLRANQKPADFAERESGLAAREQAVREAQSKIDRASIEQRIDKAIADGRMLKAQRAQAVSFAMGLADTDATIDFGEGDAAKKVTQREAYLLQIENAPKAVEFGEFSPAPKAGDNEPPMAQVQSNIMKQVATGGQASK
jgi:Mu-like prophage I protein